MMIRFTTAGALKTLLFSTALFAGLSLLMPVIAQAKVFANKSCLKCHAEIKDMPNVVAGNFQSRSNKAKSITVQTAPGKVQVLKFTPETTIENVPKIKSLKKPIPVQVTYEMKGKDMVATAIVAKPVIEVPEKQLIDVKQLAALVKKGPKKGGYTLVDSRPGIRYQEGHIPTAIMMPFPKMPEMMAKLPTDKNALIIFYCEGFR
jgi:hypothetical protein